MTAFSKTFYRRFLPHWHVAKDALFITFRLKDSLSQTFIKKYGAKLAKSNSNLTQQRLWFKRMENQLDAGKSGPVWLKNPVIANIVAKDIQQTFEGDWSPICYCIMPNHVHLLVKNFQKPVWKIMQQLKCRSAMKSNRVLGRDGAFWQREYFDHRPRNHQNLQEIFWYILNNPVKAGLVSDWRDWEYSFVAEEYLEWVD